MYEARKVNCPHCQAVNEVDIFKQILENQGQSGKDASEATLKIPKSVDVPCPSCGKPITVLTQK